MSIHQHLLREPVQPTKLSIFALVEYPNYAFFLRYILELSPAFGCMENIDASAPLVKLCQGRWCGFVACFTDFYVQQLERAAVYFVKQITHHLKSYSRIAPSLAQPL